MSRGRDSQDPADLAEGVLRGDRRAIGRLISLVEAGHPAAQLALRRLYPATGRAHVVGVTGPPGAGKSTLVGSLGQEARRQGRRVAVLAFDPSSPCTGGALLGDRLRMGGLNEDPGAYVRSMASRGARGGLARAARDSVRVLEAAGFDLILVETVGAGQSELDVAALVQTVVVVAVPELGDEIQAIKAGVYEIADVFALNKADISGADQAALALELSTDRAVGKWQPPIVRSIATTGVGIAELLAALDEHREHLNGDERLARRSVGIARSEVLEAIRDELLARFVARIGPVAIDAAVEEVARRATDAVSAARSLVEDDRRG